jgi:hypothetical protein
MRTENVEIYSDETNRAVMRHPGRKFPGVLIQGDTLFTLCAMADEACTESGLNEELGGLRDALLDLLLHYKMVLDEHGIPLPFDEKSRLLAR